MAKYKVGDKVRFLNGGNHVWGCTDYKKCYGVVIKDDKKCKHAHIDVYNNDGSVHSEFDIGFGYCFYYSEIEPYDKPINLIRRFINAIIGWFCDPDSHSVNRYN